MVQCETKPAVDTATRPAQAVERVVRVVPRVDVCEAEGEFFVYADLPGVTADGLDLQFEKNELTVRGTRPAAHNRPAIEFYRDFIVSEAVAADRISAELKDGVLTVRLPKVEAVKPRKITVRG